MSTLWRALPADTDLLALHRLDPVRYPMLLESAVRGGRNANWDILFLHSGDGLRLQAGHGVQRLDGSAVAGGFLDALDRDWMAAGPAVPPGDFPFAGGWALFLAYELAAEIEPVLRLPVADDGSPVAIALRCPAAILRDRERGAVYAVAEPGEAAAIERIVVDLERAGTATRLADPGPCSLREAPAAAFLDGVARVHAYLRAGDVFQVNLSRRWSARFASRVQPAALYARLRAANPAPFAGLLVLPEGAIISSSPERLISVRGRRIETRPIAGTRPRLSGDDDAVRVRELIAHPKERAEHVMLIDLERNDLGRVCVPGSVKVDETMMIESYAHVHHIVSNVSGQLRAEATPGAAIRAVFPGGTITGCPKVRCMQIIAELEGEGRGIYTGAMGYLDRSGDLDLNILIRSAWLHGCDLRFRAGAGLVVDSLADAELAETRAKARGLLRALGIDA